MPAFFQLHLIIMNKHRLLLLAGLIPAFASLSHAVVLTFDDANPSSFTNAFPTQLLTGTAGSFTVDAAQDQGKVHAQLGADSQFSFARATAFSTASASYSFLTAAPGSSITYTFGNVDLLSGAGTSSSAIVGVFSGNTGGITAGSGPNDGLYFSFSQSSGNLFFRQRFNGVASDIQTIALGTVTPRYSFSTLSFTTDGTSYSIVVTQDGTGNGVGTNNPVNTSFSGTFTNVVNTSNWGANTYLGLQADSGNNTAARYSDLLVGSITVETNSPIPEPSAYAALVGVAALAGVMLRRRRK